VSHRDPRTRGRQDAWVPPTPSTGPWVWPEPPATQRPPLQRQTSTEEGGWREFAWSEWLEGIEEAPADATARRKGGRRCVLVNEGGRRYRVRLGVAGIRVFAQ